MVTATFIACAALLAFGALAWVLRPLARTHRTAAAVALVGLMAATGVLYGLVGTPAALDPTQRSMPATMEEAIARLEAELQRDPNQVEGLRLLARAYQQQGQPDKARERFVQATRLAPDDPDLQVEAAEARALGDPQRRFDATAVQMLQAALRVQPMHQRGRWFLGIAQRQAGDDAAAATTWEPLLAVADASTAAALRPQIDAARKAAGLPPLAADAPASPTTPASGSALRVRVSLAPALLEAGALPADASVFVIARKPGGPPMPVAVEKHPLSALPLDVTLDDADGPMPTQKLSALPDVELVARISTSGNAMRQAGDIASTPIRVTLPATTPVEIVIGPGKD